MGTIKWPTIAIATRSATTCDGDLAPTTGQAVGCRVTSGEDSIDVRATVTEIQGGLVNFDVEQV